jgi:hypothetical protein
MAANMHAGPTRIRLPDPSMLDVTKPQELSTYLRTLNTALANAFSQRPAATMPTAATLLSAPNGAVYEVKVDDAGVISTTLKQGPHVSPP